MKLRTAIAIVLSCAMFFQPTAIGLPIALPGPQVAAPLPGKVAELRAPPADVADWFAFQRDVFTALFPGKPFFWSHFPYSLRTAVSAPGIYLGEAEIGPLGIGPFTLTVHEAYPTDIASLPVSQELKTEGMAHGFQCALVLATIETPAATVYLYGATVSHTTHGLESKFLPLDYGPLVVTPALTAAPCSLVPGDYELPRVATDLCGPPCDPELGGMEIDQACVDACGQTYRNEMVDSCVTYTTDLNTAESNYTGALAACAIALSAALLVCAKTSFWSWLTGGAPTALCIAAAAILAAACVVTAAVFYSLAKKTAKDNHDVRTTAAENKFAACVANCCVPCKTKDH